MSWDLYQYKRERVNFELSLNAHRFGEASTDQLFTQYSIMMSRVNVLTRRSKFSLLGDLDKAKQLLIGLNNDLLSIKPIIEDMSGSIGQYELVIDILQQHEAPMNMLLSNVLQGGTDEFNMREELARNLQMQVMSFFILMVVSGSAVIILLVLKNRQSERLALRDSLTQLPNRLSLLGQIDNLDRTESYVLFRIDVNGFKSINATQGYEAGNKVILEMAQRLQAVTQENDKLDHLGGNEFAILHERTNEDNSGFVDTILNAFITPFQIEGRVTHLEVNIGAANFPLHAKDALDLLRNADVALSRCKLSHDYYAHYVEEMAEEAKRTRQLSEDLRVALQTNDQLKQLYQPIVKPNTGEYVGTEALLRWRHPTYGWIDPLEIIDVAEQSQLAEELESWIVNHAIESLASWQKVGWGGYMSINASPSIHRFDFESILQSALTEFCVDANSIIIELPRFNIKGEQYDSTELLKRLETIGVKLALDYLGAGSSSLNHVLRLPLYQIKVERNFIAMSEQDERVSLVLNYLVKLAKEMDLVVVCTGIENDNQLKVLVEPDVELLAQGFLFARPMDRLEFEQRWHDRANVP